MHFKRFLDIKPEISNLFIVFINNKVLYDLNEKTFLLNSSYLNFNNFNLKKIGIAEDNGTKFYLIDLSNESFNFADQGYQSLVEYDLRYLMTILSEEKLSLVGRANQLLHYLKSNKHCGYCGSIMEFDSDEEAMFCTCNNVMVYPRISPCVLALIKKDNQILLARNALFPEGLYSALAGFIEISETAEETVKREVFEEVSLKVNNINYYSSQAWPFPSQLMLAYTCDYESGEIKVDGKEIIEAKWFDIDNLPNTPPNSTLSGRLINSCILDR